MIATMPLSEAQSALYSINDIYTTNSLIREFQPGIDIVYNDKGKQSFLYVDRLGGMVYEAPSPYQIEVTDMEIYEENLYFCGRLLTATNINFVGFFEINDLFFGSQQVTILPIPYNPIDTVNSVPLQGEFVLSKIEVYKVPRSSSDETHIYMIGDVSFNSSATTDYSCILDMKNSGPSWSYDLVYEPDRVYYFNDLTVTDSFLVVVGNKHGGTGEYMHGYSLPLPGDPTTFDNTLYAGGPSTGFIQYWFTNAFEYHPISKPLIETLTGNAFATACYGKWQDNPGVIVTWYSTYGSIVYRYFVPNVTMTSEFKDLKYNPATDNLFLMPDHFNSGTTNAFYGFGLAAGTCNTYWPLLDELHSLDRVVDNIDVVASGMIDGNLAIMKMETGESECVPSSELTVDISKEPPHCSVFVHDVSNCKVLPVIVNPEIKEYGIERICGEENRNENKK